MAIELCFEPGNSSDGTCKRSRPLCGNSSQPASRITHPWTSLRQQERCPLTSSLRMPDTQAYMPETYCDHCACWVPRPCVSRRHVYCMHTNRYSPGLQGRKPPTFCISSQAFKTRCFRKFHPSLTFPCWMSAQAASSCYPQTYTTTGRPMRWVITACPCIQDLYPTLARHYRTCTSDAPQPCTCIKEAQGIFRIS